MKNLYTFNKLIYRGNIDRDFFLYCCKRNKKLYFYILNHIFFFILSFISLKAEVYYKRTYHRYLQKIKDLDIHLKEFKSKYNYKINAWYLDRYSEKNTIISYSPDILTKLFLKKENLNAPSFTKTFELDFVEFNNKINELKEEYQEAYYNSFSQVNLNKAKYKYIKKANLFIQYNNKIYNILKRIIRIVIPLLLALILLLISFSFTTVFLDTIMINNYLHEPKLLLLNIIPILLMIIILLFLTKRLWISFSNTSVILFIIGIINKTKLYYRDDVFKFEDITLFKEAFIMTSRYDIIIRWYTIICAIFCLIIVILLKKHYKKINYKNKITIPLTAFLIILSIITYQKIYINREIYNSVGNTSNINIWIGTRQSQIRGLIYPFIYSSTEMLNNKPEGYNEKEVKSILDNYTYEDIPDNKKVNIIAIMLEAYNDFSKFDSIEFTTDIYEKFHSIQNNSLHGNIIVDIFGGGTVRTERRFLTGYYNLPTFRKETNSYARYFKEQGYIVEAMHPIYGAFYNRNTANNSMGFDTYWNYENRFSTYSGWGGFASDQEIYSELIKDLEQTNKNGNLYFNFTVTYQNHGPYSTDVIQETYIKQENYSDEAYNMFNRYLTGIKSSNDALYELVKYLDNYKEPTILIVFGDHNPNLGEANYGYNELGINLDLTTTEGFENYYSIPYIIHANSGAKEIFDKAFEGELDTISPNYLMNELFEYLELQGNEYLQYTSAAKDKVSVINDIYYKENNEYVPIKDSKYKDLINDFEKVSYYWINKK